MKPRYRIKAINLRYAETLEDWQRAYELAKVAYRDTLEEVRAYCKCELKEGCGCGYFVGKRDGIRFETEIVLR